MAGPLGDLAPYGPGYRGGVWVAAGDVNGDGADEVLTAAGAGADTELQLFDGARGIWVNDATVSGASHGVGILNWGGQPAVGVLGDTALNVYTLGPDFADAPTLLGSVDASGWGGGSGASLGGSPPAGSAASLLC